MVPLTDEDTDLTRQGMAVALALPSAGRALPLVRRGQRYALRPLMPARLGPVGALLGIPLPMRPDGTPPMPALPATALQQALVAVAHSMRGIV